MKLFCPDESWFNRYLGGGAPKTKLPPLADPAPTPESIDEGAAAAGDATRRRLSKRKGRSSLVLTEPTLGTSSTQRASLLGNVGAV